MAELTINPTQTTKTIKVYPTPFGTIYHSESSSNCKLTQLEYIQQIAKDEGKPYFDAILKQSRQLVQCNVNNLIHANWIKNNYEYYSYDTAPVGYNNGDQHHFIIRNRIGYAKENYMRDKVVPVVEQPIINKEAIKEKITSFLKTKRRKLDVVDEIMNSF